MEDNWSTELGMLRRHGVALAKGLTEDELHAVEELHRIRFPPDLRSLLSSALPVGHRFPDWRTPGSPSILDQFAWPFEGIAFDIEHSAFWWPEWGPRPVQLAEAIAQARRHVESCPRLIPVFGHRYLPAEPELAGNPIFSVYQTDIIYYGSDLRQYLSCEFGGAEWTVAVGETPRRIRLWTDLAEANE